MSWTAEEALEVARLHHETAKKMRTETKNELAVMLFFLFDDNGKNAQILSPLPDPARIIGKYAAERLTYSEYRDMQMDIVRQAAKAFNAEFVIHTSEAWYVETSNDDPEQQRQTQELAAQGRLRESPLRKERIITYIDGPGLSKGLHTDILPDGTLGPTEEINHEHDLGRVSNLSGRLGEN